MQQQHFRPAMKRVQTNWHVFKRFRRRQAARRVKIMLDRSNEAST